MTTSAFVVEDSPPAVPATTPVPSVTEAVTEAVTDLPTTAAEADIVETTTITALVEAKELSAEDPIISDLPEIDTVDQNTIEEGALQVTLILK